MNRINILLIHEKVLNERNSNLDLYCINENTPTVFNNFSETPHDNISFNTSADDTEPVLLVTSQMSSKTRKRSTSINPIPDFTTGSPSPGSQNSNMDIIYEKFKIQSFKDNILQNLC